MNELALFAGAGGGILGGKLLGWRTVCAVELDGYAQRVLQARQDDHCLTPFPIWDDITTFDGKPWNGVVDIVTGGFPCQDISAAGKGAGIGGARSGLWGHMARIIGEVGPRYVLVENSPLLTGRGLWRVLGDLASLGYDARWGVLGAHHAGAPHKRDRIWIVANAKSPRLQANELVGNGKKVSVSGGVGSIRCRHCDHSNNADRGYCWWCNQWLHDVANASCGRCSGQEGGEVQQQGRAEALCSSDAVADPTNYRAGRREQQSEICESAGGVGVSDDWWKAEPELGRVADGVANRTHRLRCLGNGQVPAVVRLAWNTLKN